MGNTLEAKVIFRELLGKTPTVSHHKCEIILKRINVHILEMEDVLFHLNSAVLMPAAPKGKSAKQGSGSSTARQQQEKVTGVKALALVFKQFEFNPDKRIVIAGHTDTSGEAKYNFGLSELRAKNVLFLLVGDRVNWSKVCYEKHKVEDCQQILKHVFTHRKWPCNPGKIDDKWGPNTERATENFIQYYNSEFATKHGLTRLSGDVIRSVRKDSKHRWPEELWVAIFELYNRDICEVLKVTPEQLDQRRIDDLKFASSTKKYVGCGESFPIEQSQKDNYRSQTNRRVVILFFDKDEVPVLDCPVDVDAVHKEKDCPLWHGFHFIPVYIDPSDLYAVVYHIGFKYFDRVAGKVLDVPEGIDIRAYENGADELTAVATYKSGVYSVKVQFKSALDDPARKSLHFEFKTNNQWIFTENSGATPKLVTELPDDVKAFDLPKRMKYYDLPSHWSSQNYWTRYDGNMNTGERFENVLTDKKKLKPFGTNVTAPSKPLLFFLDDIVLVDKDGKQNIKDKKADDSSVALSDKSRFSLFYVKAQELVLYKPESANAPYFTKHEFKSNLITDIPTDGQTRMVAFANDFYHVYSRRAGQGADPFDPAKHVRGCRAARLEDTDWHVGGKFDDDNNTWGHQRYFTAKTGNFELHYIHDGCVISGPDGLKRRSFVIVYWNAFYKSNATHPVNAAKVKNFATKGMLNSFKRWEDKGYTIEPFTKKASDIQIKPLFFFEAKQNSLGGKPKCTVTVSSDSSTGWMGITTSDMYWKDYKVRDYLGVGTFADIDGKNYDTLVVSHELNHAMGKDDEYAYDDRFDQYYPAMPYQDDDGSMMIDNRAPRMKHLWFYVNWINDASSDANQLQPFLKGVKFKLCHRFGTKTLNYYLSGAPNDYRDIYKPFKLEEDVSTGTGKVDLALYKLGEDEAAWNMPIDGKKMPFAFDGIMGMYLKIAFSFKPGSAGAWSAADKRDWLRGLRNVLSNMNKRFYLQNATEPHDFKNSYIFLFPVCRETAPVAANHYDIEVTLNDSSSITSKHGKTLKIGNETSKTWVANYILGKDNGAFVAFFKRLFGADKPGKGNLAFVEKWFKSELGNNNFMLKGD
ncbi:MAG: OmpA family protein [Candidatus Zixiibacteriota bacterium]